MDRERVGVLVLRAWMEDGSAASLRVRISKIEDITAPRGQVEVVTARTSQQACDIVKDWLDARLKR